MEKFIIDGRYVQLLMANGVDPSAVLRVAGLPIDTFAHQTLKLTETDYFKMIGSIDSLTDDPLLPTKLVAIDNIETFSPPIFAAYCSQNGEQFLQRLAHYKKLVGPVTYRILQEEENTTITLLTLNVHEPPPTVFCKGGICLYGSPARESNRKGNQALKGHNHL
ncbi:AraC family transcriptional regulator ligand-binding domain-containing protein [Limosilactobacillus oris]|uniref:AraC family transcriptional regulator ligand-binding domain-containing protein n=1 Tax=Limosilactobacillus oris TaxID=1632 RepID=UPI001CDB090C|nr:AraC family transcriptional regulator ligand-binding domain-containing protein [Limosilactobacillus oris]